MIDAALPGFSVEAVWDGACSILDRIGLLVDSEKVARLVSKALAVDGGRARFPREVVEHYADEIRAAGGAHSAAAPPGGLVLINSCFSNQYIDPRTGKKRPFDVKTLVRCTKLAYRLKDEGLLNGRVAGYPLDVPPRLQFLTAYFIDCCYGRSAGPYCLSNDEAVLKYMMEIGSVMGHARVVGAEPVSPLKFVGASVNLAAEHCRGDVTVWVDAMPLMGVTAPLDWHAAWAQSVAENLGSFILLRTCGCEKVAPPSFRVFLPNMATGTAYFSSPQHIFAMLSRRKVREFFALTTDGAELMLVTAKAPDQQAAAEKTAGAVLAKIFDFPYVEGAGNLWMDEIFSPQQLMIDLDICACVSAMKADFRQTGPALLQVIAEGVQRGSFLETDMTLGRYGEFLWRPAVFDLTRRGEWNERAAGEKAAEWAEAKAAEYDYELAGEKREQLERIMAAARREISA